MLAISRAFRPSEPRWERVTVVFNATATPIVVAGTSLWLPTAPGFVRGLIVVDDSAAPLVGNAGATTLAIGTTLIVNSFIAATALASFGLALEGWGVGGPLNSTNAGNMDSGVVVAPVGSIPGRAAVARNIAAYANAGNITGTLHVNFEFRRFAGTLG